MPRRRRLFFELLRSSLHDAATAQVSGDESVRLAATTCDLLAAGERPVLRSQDLTKSLPVSLPVGGIITPQ